MTAPLNTQRRPPLKLAGAILLIILALIVTFVSLEFRGKLTPTTQLTVLSIAPLLASTIRAVFENGSVTGLFDGDA